MYAPPLAWNPHKLGVQIIQSLHTKVAILGYGMCMFDFNCIMTVFFFDIASDITCNVAVELLATTMLLVPLSYDM